MLRNSMDSITLKAPAKLNLFLEVLGKRRDGYHNIITIFERINLCDDIVISIVDRGIKVFCDQKIPEKENLAYKAAKLILSRSKVNQGVFVKITKNIPIASGMGGGSSDAAYTLIGINKLFKLGYKKDGLIRLGRLLGSDVPFFILERSFAIGKGRGDSVKGLDFTPPKIWHLLMFPGVKKLTKDIYRALKLDLTKKVHNVKMLEHALKMGDFDLMKETTYNRLEGPAFDREPRLSAIKSSLIKLGIKGASLTGSGPTIFGIVKSRKEAISLSAEVLKKRTGFEKEGWRLFIAHTL
ncbi:MAG: 4-(cytidine 5'-diphospho)-2-C-methyl-D-erythritol kinase [Candidatus Omnitrophica bacterium CG07_land_8_20_14_0_80_42_15]|uniref:4-diphosphocytidyl-2-C-methyl-D-erythritol kinase n=1 Tax=Candidatus Aquitaenariimonas noxiae TaxID=1974741 RepID=A0A2J0KUT2_9BACT|nr:MAG: 4-(cytidine 5'-diphospho)-2-C-methyl-D-erythritol kinase [Candidatus Omnitrophica bacterium CG07_land_8_20_14_0_80_42_15]